MARAAAADSAPPGTHAALLRLARVDALRIPKDKNAVEGVREAGTTVASSDGQERHNVQWYLNLARKRANAVGFILTLSLSTSRLFYILMTSITFLQVRGMGLAWCTPRGLVCGSRFGAVWSGTSTTHQPLPRKWVNGHAAGPCPLLLHHPSPIETHLTSTLFPGHFERVGCV